MSTTADLTWDDLRYFLAVARTGRLARAGRTLGVRHTTVGRRIDALETALGARLFFRTADGWKPTRAGERIVRRAEAVEAEVRSIVGSVQDADALAAGRVRVALVDTWAAHWLVPRLGELLARHPALQVDLLTSTSQLNLTRGEADIAIRTPRPTQRDLAAVPLVDGAIALFGTRELVRRHAAGLRRDPPRLEGVPLAIYTSEFTPLMAAPWFAAARDGDGVRVRSSNTQALLEAARLGLGLAPLPRFVAARAPELVDATGRDLARLRVWLAFHRELRDEPRVRAVVDFLREIAADITR